MVMLSVDFDESYNQRTIKEPDMPLIYTVGGYIAADQQWKAFNKEWDKVLKSAGIKFFHMTDFESRFGDYKEWSNEQRIKILESFYEIIHKYVLKGFTTSVVLEDYNNLSDQHRNIFGEPHLCALFNCMKHIYEMCNEYNFEESIAYSFEFNRNYNSKIMNIFNGLGEQSRKGYRIGSVSFVEKECLPVQASDILVYEVTKEIARQRHKSSKRPTRQSMRHLALPRIDEWFYMDQKEFLKSIQTMKDLGLYNDENSYEKEN